MQPPLTDVEARLLGSLIEKEATTPDNYPLSLGSLTAACNQTSNREPVMRLDEETVAKGTISLRRRGLLRAMQPAGSRVTKYSHLLADALNADARELALLSVLMLRGAQTAGELYARTARLAEFGDVAAVEATLQGLMAREPEALAARLPLRPGQREVRYAHLLSGEPATPDAREPGIDERPFTAPPPDRLAALERNIEDLRGELEALKAQFVAFREQF